MPDECVVHLTANVDADTPRGLPGDNPWRFKIGPIITVKLEPMGEGVPNFIQVQDDILRAAAVRWGMPTYFFDAPMQFIEPEQVADAPHIVQG